MPLLKKGGEGNSLILELLLTPPASEFFAFANKFIDFEISI